MPLHGQQKLWLIIKTVGKISEISPAHAVIEPVLIFEQGQKLSLEIEHFPDAVTARLASKDDKNCTIQFPP